MEKHERLQHARERAGYVTKADGARAAGVGVTTYVAHESGQNGFNEKLAMAYAKAFRVSPQWLMFGIGKPSDGPKEAASVAIIDAPTTTVRDMPADIPLIGQTVGGDGGFFLQNGEVADYVRRPPGLANQRTVFALSVIGSSMAPRYEDGDIVYVSTTRRPQILDDVIVEMAEEEDGSPGESFIKRLVRRSPTTITCEQFNPGRQLEYPASRVKNLYRVIPWREVIGI